MKTKLAKITLFILGLVILQQGIAWGSSFGQLRQQTIIINERDIDPAALFYTESVIALSAEKQVRRKIKEI